MNIEEVKELIRCGMFVGSHGSKHYWLDRVSEEQQRDDIVGSLGFLEEVGANLDNWIMCYPYGAYNENTLSITQELGALIGVTTEPRIANLCLDPPLTLPRLDTNDLKQ